MTAPTATPMHTTSVRIDADLWADTKRRARRLGVSNSEVIRAALREYLARASQQTRIEVVEAILNDHMRGSGQLFQRVARLERECGIPPVERLPLMRPKELDRTDRARPYGTGGESGWVGSRHD